MPLHPIQLVGLVTPKFQIVVSRGADHAKEGGRLPNAPGPRQGRALIPIRSVPGHGRHIPRGTASFSAGPTEPSERTPANPVCTGAADENQAQDSDPSGATGATGATGSDEAKEPAKKKAERKKGGAEGATEKAPEEQLPQQ